MSITQLEQETSSININLHTLDLPQLYQELTLAQDPIKISELVSVIVTHINHTHGYQFQGCLQFVLKIVTKGYANLLTPSTQLLLKIMAHFATLSKALKSLPSPQLQYRQLFTLSILAEIVRQESKCELPFTADFLRELFELEVEQVDYDSRPRLLTLLAVLYSNLSRQSVQLRKLKMAARLKEAILSNYSLVSDVFTAKLLNQCIVQLQTRKLVVFTVNEIERYGIKKALVQTIGNGKKEIIQKYLEKLFGKKQS